MRTKAVSKKIGHEFIILKNLDIINTYITLYMYI